MTFDDWLTNFHEVVFCHLFPDGHTAEVAEDIVRIVIIVNIINDIEDSIKDLAKREEVEKLAFEIRHI